MNVVKYRVVAQLTLSLSTVIEIALRRVGFVVIFKMIFN